MTAIVNSYFNQSKTTEQSLLNSLIIESIQVTGHQYYYLPREIQREDLIMGEDVISKFGLAIPIEMYLADAQGFQGDKEMFSKFGLEIRNSYKLVVSKDRWEAEVKSQFDGSQLNGEAPFSLVTNLRPQEGDLIYDPLTTGLYEIKFVDHDVEFYQIGKNYMYHLSCEAFQYSQETISTGIAEIDAFETGNDLNILSFQVKTETGDILVLEGEDCDSYILQEFGQLGTARSYGTDFKAESLLVEFSASNPFGGM